MASPGAFIGAAWRVVAGWFAPRLDGDGVTFSARIGPNYLLLPVAALYLAVAASTLVWGFPSLRCQRTPEVASCDGCKGWGPLAWPTVRLPLAEIAGAERALRLVDPEAPGSWLLALNRRDGTRELFLFDHEDKATIDGWVRQVEAFRKDRRAQALVITDPLDPSRWYVGCFLVLGAIILWVALSVRHGEIDRPKRVITLSSGPPWRRRQQVIPFAKVRAIRMRGIFKNLVRLELDDGREVPFYLEPYILYTRAAGQRLTTVRAALAEALKPRARGTTRLTDPA